MSKRKMRHAAQQPAAHMSAPTQASAGTAPRADALTDDAVLEGGPALSPQAANQAAANDAPPATQPPTKASPAAALEQSAAQPAEPSMEQPTEPPAGQPAAAVDPLMHEVQMFLSQRETLARKLAAEIEATERKLLELKQTAARLFPADNDADGRDRKARKAKAKPAGRAPRPDASAGSEDRIPGGGG